MHFAIAGAGAMGSMFGGYLAVAGHDVTLVDVDAEHLAAVRDRGLLLRHADGRGPSSPSPRHPTRGASSEPSTP
jgi:ketopantoate reductase